MSFVAESRAFRHSGRLPLQVQFLSLPRPQPVFNYCLATPLQEVDKTPQAFPPFKEVCRRVLDAVVGDLFIVG